MTTCKCWTATLVGVLLLPGVAVSAESKTTADGRAPLETRIPADWHEYTEDLIKARNWNKIENDLIEAGYGEHLIPALAETVTNTALDGYRDRIPAINALVQIGPKASPAILAILKAQDEFSRRLAVGALARIKPPGANVVPAMADRMLNDTDPGVRLVAAHCLGDLGPEGRVAIPSLVRAVQGSQASLRWEACEALGKMGRHAADAVPTLILCLQGEYYKEDTKPRIEPPLRPNAAYRHPDSRARVAAAHALARIGSAARHALPALKRAFRERDVWIGMSAAYAAILIDGPNEDALTVVTLAIRNEDPEVRRDAAWYLGSLGRKAVQAIPELERAVEDENARVRTSAEEALDKIRKGAGAQPKAPADADKPRR